MLYKELRCPLDSFELVMHSTGSNGRSYPLCPYCYNHPPFENMSKGSGCNACVNSMCRHSAINQGVAPCVDCDSGILVLDPVSKPKWRLACNQCNVIVMLVEDAHDTRVAKVRVAFSSPFCFFLFFSFSGPILAAILAWCQWGGRLCGDDGCCVCFLWVHLLFFTFLLV